jgi:GT2 family glycosyltransferase
LTFRKSAALVLTWNNFFDTKECIEPLVNAEGIDVFVIDNGSDDTHRADLNAYIGALGNVRLFQSERNLGFATGVNYGLSLVNIEEYEEVILINNDTKFDLEQIHNLVCCFRADGCDIGAPLITYYPETDIIWQAGSYLSKYGSVILSKGKKQAVDNFSVAEPYECDFVSGCVLIVKTTVINDDGFLDGDYFYSIEDLDFCKKAKSKGRIIKCFPNILIHHKVSVSSGGWLSRFSIEHFVWGRGRLLAKCHRQLDRLIQIVVDVFGYIPNRVLRANVPIKDKFLFLIKLYSIYRCGFRNTKLNYRN